MRPTRSALSVTAVVVAVAAGAPGSVAAARPPSPTVLEARWVEPTIIGRTASLHVVAADAGRPVNGVVATFAGEGRFGASACQAGAPGAPRPAGPFAPGARARFVVPHVFRTGGARAMSVRVDAGGCLGGGAAVLHPYVVTPTPPGTAVGPFVPGLPTTSLVGPLPPLPELPAPVLDSVTPRFASASVARAARTSCRGASVVPTAASLALARRATLCLINVERTARGLPLLHSDRRLSRAAGTFAGRMVRDGFFAHVTPQGQDLVDRLRAVRYVPARRSWRIAENLGFGAERLATPRAIVRGWMGSSPHRANVLDGGFRQIGLGVAPGTPGAPGIVAATYATTFGAIRRPTG